MTTKGMKSAKGMGSMFAAPKIEATKQPKKAKAFWGCPL